LKQRYRVLHQLVTHLKNLRTQNTLNKAAFEEALEDFDKERREHIKGALKQLSAFLREDDYLKPLSPGNAALDQFKVTFYAVEKRNEQDEPDPNGTEFLVPKWRAIPNEGEPRTRRFAKTDGASGRAWSTKKTVVCERGGLDPQFKDMWEGGGQKQKYKSMICVPAIEDIPTERINEVYGVLTIDTPVRDKYFSGHLEEFWGTLHQPICNLLIYCRESEALKEEIVASVRALLELENEAA
jgi:hypothetical protein